MSRIFKKEEISLIHKLWSQTGKVTYHTSKYVGKQFPTYREYLNCVADYYGIEENQSEQMGVFNTYRAMEDYATKELVGRSKCDVKIICVSIDPKFSVDSNSDMQIIYNHIGGINTAQFKYTIDESYKEIPEDEYDDYYDEGNHPDYDLEYHDDMCITYVVRDVIRLVENRFGVRLGSIGTEGIDKEAMAEYTNR